MQSQRGPVDWFASPSATYTFNVDGCMEVSYNLWHWWGLGNEASNFLMVFSGPIGFVKSEFCTIREAFRIS